MKKNNLFNQLKTLFNPNTTDYDIVKSEYYKLQTKANWTNSPCGSNTSNAVPLTLDYFEEIENYRYKTHPWIKKSIDSFDIQDKDVLEIGFGMGTDHLNIARRGAIMHGIDLTPRNIEVTQIRLKLYGLDSKLLVGDAEKLPYVDNSFDFVYSFGVIHHSPDTSRIISEIHRILKPGGKCWITVYNKNSIVFWWSIYFWNHLLKQGYKKYSLKERLSLIEYPNNNPNLVIKLYTKKEFEKLFSKFSSVASKLEHLLPGDIAILQKIYSSPKRSVNFFQWLGRYLGWYIVIEAKK